MWFEFQLSFLIFVKSVTCKPLDSMLGLNFFISTPMCSDDWLYILTRRSHFSVEKLTQLLISSSVCIIKLKYFLFLFFAKLTLLTSYTQPRIAFCENKNWVKKILYDIKTWTFGCQKKYFLEKSSICWSTSWPFSVKGYLRYKTIVSHKTALDV